jgi:hypothetical protein
MHIDEFLEIYTPVELERQESKLMEGGLGMMTLSRFISSVVSSGSPNKGMSPVRAARIIAGTVDNISSSPTKSPIPKAKPA